MTRRPLSLAVAALCCAALTACGSDDGTTVVAADAAPAGPSLDEVEAVVLDYVDQGIRGDVTACGHETASYAAEQDEMYGVDSCAERVEQVTAAMVDGEPFIDTSRSVVTVTEGEDGGAVAEVVHGIEGFETTFLLVVEDGAWRIDGQAPTATGTNGEVVSEEEAVEIATTFCQVELGTSRADVVGWLGEPHEESVDDDGQAELSWSFNQDSYTVWLDDADEVASMSSSTPRDEDACA